MAKAGRDGTTLILKKFYLNDLWRVGEIGLFFYAADGDGGNG